LIGARQRGILGVGMIRAMQRKIAALLGYRSRVDQGEAIGRVSQSPAIFWKERDAVAAQLRRWPSVRLTGLNGHLLEVERKLMSVKAGLTQTVLEQELTRIARAASRSG